MGIEFPPFSGGRRQCERNPVGPAACYLRREGFLGVQRIIDADNGTELRGRLGQEIPERNDVLMQLAVGDESAIAAEIQRHRGAGDLLRLVGIAEQEFAGRKRPPVAGAIDRAVAVRFAHLEVARILPLEDGIAQRIGEPEVLLGRGDGVRPARAP